MSPKQIAERVITMHMKAFDPPNPEIWCLSYRSGYGTDDIQRRPGGVEAGYGTKGQVEFFLSTQRSVLQHVLEEVIEETISTIEALEFPTNPIESKQQAIAALRARFDVNASA